LCPSDDRDGSVTDNEATFLMTNIVPQSPNSNRETWVALETYCRKLASSGNELYIIAGVLGQGGSGSNGGTTKTLAGGKIVVPESLWKVIVILPVGDNDSDRINGQTRIIAIRIPNRQSVKSNWGDYRVSVDDLEDLTGYDFLPNLSKSLQKQLESQVDKGATY
jgi:endonuclease G